MVTSPPSPHWNIQSWKNTNELTIATCIRKGKKKRQKRAKMGRRGEVVIFKFPNTRDMKNGKETEE